VEGTRTTGRRRAYIPASRFLAIKAVVSSCSVASHLRPVGTALPLFRLLLQQGQHVQGDDGTLAGRQVAAVEVGGDDPLDGRAAARPFGEAGRYPGHLAGGEAVAAIENLAPVDHDGLEQATELDVLGKLPKLGIGQQRKCETGGWKLYGAVGGFMAAALEIEGILPQQFPGCQVLLGGSPPGRKTLPATEKSRRRRFLENAFCKSVSLYLEPAGSRVDDFGNVLPGRFSSVHR
jgi:hypothetical protein